MSRNYYHFESKVSLQAATAAADGRMTSMGNIKNPELLLHATPGEVAASSGDVIATGVQILAPECAVPLRTPLENLKAIARVRDGTLDIASKSGVV